MYVFFADYGMPSCLVDFAMRFPDGGCEDRLQMVSMLNLRMAEKVRIERELRRTAEGQVRRYLTNLTKADTTTAHC